MMKPCRLFFLSYEVKAKDTTQLADIAITLATSREERLIDIVHEYLQQLWEQHNRANCRRLVVTRYCWSRWYAGIFSDYVPYSTVIFP